MTIAALVASVTAAGANLDARDEPSTTSRIDVDERGPAKKCERDKDFTSSGVAAVVSRACTFQFQLAPSADKDPNRDFKVYWLQSSIHPRRNFCVTDVTSEIRIPDGYRIEAKTPRFKRTDSPKRVKARLRVDAGGGRQNDQIVKQTFRLFPRTLKPNLDDNKMTLDWDGATSRDLGFAMGIVVSYPDEDLPKGRVHGAVDSILRRSC